MTINLLLKLRTHVPIVYVTNVYAYKNDTSNAEMSSLQFNDTTQIEQVKLKQININTLNYII